MRLLTKCFYFSKKKLEAYENGKVLPVDGTWDESDKGWWYALGHYNKEGLFEIIKLLCKKK